MRKRITILVSIIMCMVLSISPIFFSIVYAFNLEKIYSESYIAALSDKVKTLKETDEEKIVLIGGSNLPFGVDSELLSQKLGKPVVNFGLYAALGTKIMLDLSKSGLNKNDTVIFSIEYSSQTYSNYINPEVTLQALDVDYSLHKYIPANDMLQVFSQIGGLISNKKKYIELGVSPSVQAAYSRAAINKVGDNTIERPYNILPDMYDSTNLVTINKSIISPDFISYVNDFSRWAKRKDINILFSFPPVNRLSLDEFSQDEENRYDFYEFIINNFDADVISSIEDYIIHEDYFYDSNYHLNESGVILRTDRLLSDIKRYNKDSSANNIDVPQGSGKKPSGEIPDIEGDPSDNFVYEEVDGKIAIIGLSEQGKTLTNISIPSKIEGKQVYKISQGAFSNANSLTSLTIPSTVQILENSLFASSLQLTSVYLMLPADITSSLPIVGSELLEGASSNIKIYVPSNWYTIITNDYFWGVYVSNIYSL